MSKAEIEIRGKTFSIACADGQEARLEALGRKLNARLTDLETAIGDVGETRLLVAAGISLIDELETIKPAESNSEISDLENRITLVERTAAAALSDAADRINSITDRIERVS
ncbi:MAG: cell division protein ZapA [Ponticaulis sp.]|nr:cell division protein ZapA [Ponticaulis sp.]|tara:strand:+ start:20122 stop:20457 length:336 start_codon:yes stop_codon:yes gene_type:complete